MDQDELILEYLDFVLKYEDNEGFVKSHLHKMAHMGFKEFEDLREKMIKSEKVEDIREVIKEL